MRTRWIVVCVVVLVACDFEAPNLVHEQGPALEEVDIEITRPYMFRELKRARHDLMVLKGPGGSDYARKWGMTRDEGITSVRQALYFWSQALGPVPQDEASDASASGVACTGQVSWVSAFYPDAYVVAYSDSRGDIPYIYMSAQAYGQTNIRASHYTQVGLDATGDIGYSMFDSERPPGCTRTGSAFVRKMFKLDRDIDTCITARGNHSATASNKLGVTTRDELCYNFRVGRGGSGPGQDDSGAGGLEEEGYTCWWFAYDGDVDDGGWWVCELVEY